MTTMEIEMTHCENGDCREDLQKDINKRITWAAFCKIISITGCVILFCCSIFAWIYISNHEALAQEVKSDTARITELEKSVAQINTKMDTVIVSNEKLITLLEKQLDKTPPAKPTQTDEEDE